MRTSLPLLAVVLGACGSPSDPTGFGNAWVQGQVSQVSGVPLVHSTVRVACGHHGAQVVVATDSAGHYITQLSVDGASQLDTALGFAGFGALPALRVVDLRERPSL